MKCQSSACQTCNKAFSLLPGSVLWNSPLLLSHFFKCSFSSKGEEVQSFLWPSKHTLWGSRTSSLLRTFDQFTVHQSVFLFPTWVFEDSSWFFSLVYFDLVLEGSPQASDGSKTWQQPVRLLDWEFFKWVFHLALLKQQKKRKSNRSGVVSGDSLGCKLWVVREQGTPLQM